MVQKKNYSSSMTMLIGYKTMSFNTPLSPPSVWLCGLPTIKPIHHLLREGHETDPVYQSLSLRGCYCSDDRGCEWRGHVNSDFREQLEPKQLFE